MWVSVVEGSIVAEDVQIGPYAHIRPGCHIGPRCEIMDHAELKNSSLGAGTKQHHFSYLGDAEIGEEVNIGAGAITANFDGEAQAPHRHRRRRLHRRRHPAARTGHHRSWRAHRARARW